MTITHLREGSLIMWIKLHKDEYIIIENALEQHQIDMDYGYVNNDKCILPYLKEIKTLRKRLKNKYQINKGSK